jgi:hypothetical protein
MHRIWNIKAKVIPVITRETGTIPESFIQDHSTQYTQHILPQHSNIFNDVILLIIPQIL